MKKRLMKIFPWLMAIAMLFALAGCEAETVTTTLNKTVTTTVANTTTVNNAATVTSTVVNTSTVTSTLKTTKTETTTVAPPVTLSVSAAASLTDALEAVNALYMEQHSNVTIVANYAASGTLQTQIEQGATCDVFLSAAAKQMNNLENEGLILSNTRIDLLKNSIVLIIPKASTLEIDSFEDLLEDYVTMIAVGDPAFVPAGTYAYQLFDLLGITDELEASGKLIQGSSVRDVLAYVETGNVDAGIVYSTDAVISDGVKIVATAPDEINSKIIYPAAIIKASENQAAAADYLAFLSSDAAIEIFKTYGFLSAVE
jgi:molybdate transport system substrate-binding protein